MNYNKKKTEEFIATIQKLEKQKVELINAFKKQLQLIENLRRQKAHLEASHLIQFTEDEFLQLLDWNPEKKEKKSQNNTDANL
ncbi:uncharacterized protein GBIM_16878 [Gryllus bimaculatus]|nr:uncharacterized protein GBIM_16878 [Gryllus bimaculatus]